MKPIRLNDNSWHNKIASAFGGDVGSFNDICGYTCKMIWAMIKMLTVGVGCLFLLTVFLTTIITPILILLGYHVYSFAMGISSVGIGVLLFTGIGFAGQWIVDTYEERKYNSVRKPDGFIKHAYKSFKDKTCVRIEFR